MKKILLIYDDDVWEKLRQLKDKAKLTWERFFVGLAFKFKS